MADVPSETLPPGTRVEVRRRFDAGWSKGFEVAGAYEEGYRIRRLSDGVVLPVEFEPDHVRRERKRETWWI
ncbi:MAG: hypothetical protein ACRD0U_01660 [Acidimicrobiales bacterium]